VLCVLRFSRILKDLWTLVLTEESGTEKVFLLEDREPGQIQEPGKVNAKLLQARRRHQLRNNIC
jgi:hypothetical protein